MRRAHLTPRRAVAALVVVLALIGAACGSDGNDATRAAGRQPGATTTAMAMGGKEESFAFGHAADPGDADRTVDVSMRDSFSYDPPSVTVSTGDTVLFTITNEGKVAHEFVLGDKALQDDHEQEMAAMASGMTMADEPNAVVVQPGKTKQLAFTFTKAGDLEFACHQPGHDDAGMIGKLSVT